MTKEPSAMASETKDKSRKPWAVVQDVSPFGIRVECRHRYRWQARRCVGSSRFLIAMPYDVAVERDRRLAASLGIGP